MRGLSSAGPRRVSGVLDEHLVIPFERSFDTAYGLEYTGADGDGIRGRVPVTDALRGPDGAVHSGIHFAVAESLASTGTALEVVPRGLVPSGLSNSTHV